jgi:hypothetical protein
MSVVRSVPPSALRITKKRTQASLTPKARFEQALGAMDDKDIRSGRIGRTITSRFPASARNYMSHATL